MGYVRNTTLNKRINRLIGPSQLRNVDFIKAVMLVSLVKSFSLILTCFVQTSIDSGTLNNPVFIVYRSSVADDKDILGGQIARFQIELLS